MKSQAGVISSLMDLEEHDGCPSMVFGLQVVTMTSTLKE